MQTDPLGKLGTQLSKRLCTFRWRCFQTAAVWKQEQRQALSLKSTRPKKVNQRIPLNVYPPRTNEVPSKKIPVTGYIRRRAATDQIDTTLVVGFVVCSQIAEGYHITSIKLFHFSMQLSGGAWDKEQQEGLANRLAAELIAPGQTLVAGTVPGVIAGSVIRVELLPGLRVFDLVVAAILVPLGSWLATTRPITAGDSDRPIPASCCSSWRPVWAASAVIVVTLICLT